MAYDSRPGADEYDVYYARYVERVPDGDIVAILATQIEDTVALLRELNEQQAGFRYAEGKWSVKEVVGHMSDTERVFAYRALRIARRDNTLLAGFDENAWAAASPADARPLPSLIAELGAVRAGTVSLLAGLAPDDWTRRGRANDREVSVRALAWITAGHELHHRAILAERYVAPRPAR
jgi:uncharacterized damage-inducible protein DinB